MKTNKKLLGFALSLLLLISSCSKNDNPIETPVANQKLYNVTFNLSTFKSDIGPLSALKSSAVNQTVTQAAPTLSDQITKLEYLIYNSSGQLLKDSVQNSGSYNFGIINQQLPAGSYKLIVAGTSGAYTILSTESSTSVFLSTYLSNGIGDWFKQVADFTVTDQVLSQSVVLERVVGKIGFVLTDPIPRDIGKLALVFTSGSWVRLNSPGDPVKAVQTIEIPLKYTQEGTVNFSSSAFVIPMYNGSITTDVSIRAYNTMGALIVEKIIKDVIIEKNKMTTLSGALFTSLPSSTATSVTVNSVWKPTTTVTF